MQLAGLSPILRQKLCFLNFLYMIFFLRIHGIAVAKGYIIGSDSSILTFDLLKLFYGAVGCSQGEPLAVAR